MGGGYYEGDVSERTSTGREVSFSYAGGDASAPAALRGVHADLSPLGSNRDCTNETPIVVAFDVTRSRGDDAKHVYDKMPMLIGQIHMRGYVSDPAISFAAIGDATSDRAPLQVGIFAGDNRLDSVLEHVWLEEGGGGTGQESYELAAYYYAHHAQLDCVARGKKGYFFFIGDEGFYPKVSKEQVAQLIGDTLASDLDTADVFRRLQERFRVFFIYPQATWEARRADIDAEIQARVIEAGGMHGGVDIRASLLWNNRNDLDLHVMTPAGEHIYFGSKRATCGGELDVDRNVRGETTKPVENTRWARGGARAGRYRVSVQNYAFHEAVRGPTPFRVELEVNGVIQHFEGVASPRGETGVESEITIAEFVYDPRERVVDASAPDIYAGYRDETVNAQWAAVLPPENILLLEEPKGIADLILGVLALTSGSDLSEYMSHMTERGQSEARRAHTADALGGLATSTALARPSKPLELDRPADVQRRGKTKRL